MPSAFAFPDRETQAWIPAYISAVYSEGGDRISLQIFGAIAGCGPGVTAAQVAAEGTARARAARDPGTAALALFGSAEPPTNHRQRPRSTWRRRRPPGHSRHARRRPVALRDRDSECRHRPARTGREAPARNGAACGARRRHGPPRAPVADGKRRRRRRRRHPRHRGRELLIAVLPAILPADFPRLDRHHARLARRAGVDSGARWPPLWSVRSSPPCKARRLDIIRSLADDASAPVGGGNAHTAARLRVGDHGGSSRRRLRAAHRRRSARPQPQGR